MCTQAGVHHAMKLRSYQQEAIDGCLRIWKEKQGAMVVVPTGGGKTIIASYIAKHFLETTNKDIIMFAHREELITQAKDKLQRITGQEVAIEMGDQHVDTRSFFGVPRIIVSSVQTLCSGSRLQKFRPEKYALLIQDEFHHCMAVTNRKVISHFKSNPDLKFLGITATPERSDKLALGTVVDDVAINYGIHDAVKDGWLVRPKQLYVHIDGIDLRHVRTTAGDLNQGDLAEIMEQDRNARAVVEAIDKHVGDKKTLVFASSVLQSDKMCVISNMLRPGSSRFICGETPKEERREIHNLFKTRQITRLFNCGVLTEGYDDPDIEVVAVARPTKSTGLYTQMVGRGLRPIDELAHTIGDMDKDARCLAISSSRKPHAEIMDFVGNSGRHKLVSLVDVLGGRLPDDVRDKVAKKAKKTGRVTDIEDEIEKAQKEAQMLEERARQRERERHEKIVARTQYTLTEVDPFDALGIHRLDNPLTNVECSEKQRIFLEKQGVNCQGMSKRDASRLIGQIMDRRNKGMPSFKQQKWLTTFGYPNPPANWKQILDEKFGKR